MKRLLTIFSIIAIMFTAFPSGVYAVSAPVKVGGVKAATVSQTQIKVSWKKVAKNRNTRGYAIYRGGKLIKRVGKNANAYTDSKLKLSTTYKYNVRAYNTYTQYYNKKTKKWVNKKPIKRYWGKCPSGAYKGKATRTAYKYGAASATVSAKTKGKTTSQNMTMKATPSGNKLTLSWTSAKSLSGKNFKIYQNGKLLTTVKATSYVIDASKLATGSYSWYVTTETSTQIWKSNTLTANWTANTTQSTATTQKDAEFSGSKLVGATMTVGKTTNFYLGTTKSITWQSSNTSVATVKSVSNGTQCTITAKGAGTATITATNWNGEKKTAKVTVQGTSSNSSSETYVTVTDYKGVKREVLKGSADEKNPKYNTQIDGEWEDETYQYVQKRGVTFLFYKP